MNYKTIALSGLSLMLLISIQLSGAQMFVTNSKLLFNCPDDAVVTREMDAYAGYWDIKYPDGTRLKVVISSSPAYTPSFVDSYISTRTRGSDVIGFSKPRAKNKSIFGHEVKISSVRISSMPGSIRWDTIIEFYLFEAESSSILVYFDQQGDDVYNVQPHVKELIGSFQTDSRAVIVKNDPLDDKIVKYNEAIDYFEHYSNSLQLALFYFERGSVYAQKQEYSNAVADFTKAIGFDPLKIDFYNNRGNTYRLLKEFNKSGRDFEKAFQLNTNNLRVYWGRGLLYRDQGENNKAVADFTKMIDLDPDDVEGYANRGDMLFAMKEYEKSIMDYTKAIQIRSNEAGLYNNRGYTFLWLSQWGEAKRDFERAVLLGMPLAFENLAIYYWAAKKDKRNALRNFEAAFKKGFDHFECLYKDDSDGYFIKDLIVSPEFITLIKKYRK